MIQYNGNSNSSSVSDPLRTISTKDRFALVQPEIVIDGTLYRLEILYRMLMPHELARAMSFPKEYKFVGNRTQVVRQIGNAVAVRIARSLVLSMISPKHAHLEVAA